jgi:hypothetical protein
MLLVVLPLAGCTTTQDVNQRYRLRASRTLASRQPLLVRRATPDVVVRGVWLVRGHGTAVIAELANRTARTLTDLPVSVGLRRAGGRRVYLNRRGGLDYFQTHVAALAPHATLRWVFTTAGRAAHGRPFATVGAARGRAAALPRLTASTAGTGGALRVRVHNGSSVPQYGLPVYALARRDGRWVAAGRTTVDELDGGAARTLGLRLTGDARRATLRLEALPTIFR